MSPETVRAWLEANPDAGLQVLRTVRLAGPWEGSWRNLYTGTARWHLAWAEPAYQPPGDIAERRARRWSWGVAAPDPVLGTSHVLGHGECDTQEEARAAADALLQSHGYGLASVLP